MPLLLLALALVGVLLPPTLSLSPPPPTRVSLAFEFSPPLSTHVFTNIVVAAHSVPSSATWLRLVHTASTELGAAAITPRWLRIPPSNVQLTFGVTGATAANTGGLSIVVPNSCASPQTNTFILEAWSDRSDLGDGSVATLLATSPPRQFQFDDLGFTTLAFSNFSVAELAPGWFTVRAMPTNASLFEQAALVSWAAFKPAAATPASKTVGRPSFTLAANELSSGMIQQDTRSLSDGIPTINVSLSQAGSVFYLGIYGAWNGEYGFVTPPQANAGVRTYRSFPVDLTQGISFQPLALVIPFENGTVPKLPAGFDGPVFHASPIPGDMNLALPGRSLTVYDGVTVFLPLRQPGIPGYVGVPELIEMQLPTGLNVLNTSASYNVVNVTANTTNPPGSQRLRLVKPEHQQWAYENWAIQLSLSVSDERLIGGRWPGRVRGVATAAQLVRNDTWQDLDVVVAAAPHARLPKRLVTNFAWAQHNTFPNVSMHGLSSVAGWRRLGFRIVPDNGVNYVRQPNASTLLTPKQRRGPEWDGMAYSIEDSVWYSGGDVGTFDVLKWNLQDMGSLKPSLAERGLSPPQVAAETRRWAAALAFYNTTGCIDMAYDGYFYHNDLARVVTMLNYTQPEFFAIDSESFPGFEQWMSVGYKSANLQARKKQGESDSHASLRVVREWMQGLSNATQRALNRTSQIYMYGAHAEGNQGFHCIPWDVLSGLGFASQPSYYGVEHTLAALARHVRSERLAVGSASARPLVPWVTPQTSGYLQGSDLTLGDVVAQLFANGATGLNVFSNQGMYDGALWLHMAHVIDTLAPFENVLVDGTPSNASTLVSSANLRRGYTSVVGGMTGPRGQVVLAATSVPKGGPLALKARAPLHANGTWVLCDLVSNTSYPVAADGWASFATPAAHTTAMLALAPKQNTPC